MEQGNCLMSMKRSVVSRTQYFASNDSPVFHSFAAGLREERAATVAAGAVEFIWPPRSYSCSFCTREFRSAQALGGHMNVHRRDRARLKQQSPNNADQRESTNQSLDHNLEANSSSGLTSRVPALSSGKDENGDVKDVALKNLGECPRKSDAVRREKNVMEASKKLDHGEVRTELSVGLNSESCQNAAKEFSCKRAKTNVSRLPLMLELVLGVLEPTNSNIISNYHEELDLELRLGADPPKVQR